MSPFFRVAYAAGMVLLTIALTGCLSSLAPPMRCAPVAVVNGKHLLLNRTDYLNVETKLSAHLADRGLTLVRKAAKELTNLSAPRDRAVEEVLSKVPGHRGI